MNIPPEVLDIIHTELIAANLEDNNNIAARSLSYKYDRNAGYILIQISAKGIKGGEVMFNIDYTITMKVTARGVYYCDSDRSILYCPSLDNFAATIYGQRGLTLKIEIQREKMAAIVWRYFYRDTALGSLSRNSVNHFADKFSNICGDSIIKHNLVEENGEHRSIYIEENYILQDQYCRIEIICKALYFQVYPGSYAIKLYNDLYSSYPYCYFMYDYTAEYFEENKTECGKFGMTFSYFKDYDLK